MASTDHVTDDELKPEETEGFKVGEKKTIEEYQKLGKCLSTTFYLTQLYRICDLIYLSLPALIQPFDAVAGRIVRDLNIVCKIEQFSYFIML
jgi:hypothetical protein